MATIDKETLQVPRLQSVVRDRRANWKQSIEMLKAAKAAGMAVTKTSIMLGCGERREEVVDAMRELRESGEAPFHSLIVHLNASDRQGCFCTWSELIT